MGTISYEKTELIYVSTMKIVKKNILIKVILFIAIIFGIIVAGCDKEVTRSPVEPPPPEEWTNDDPPSAPATSGESKSDDKSDIGKPAEQH